MLAKFGFCALALSRALDVLACAVWLSVLYPFGLADRPTGRETISAYVGTAAANGMRWGVRMARAIDWLAERLGDKPDHCARAYEFYGRLEN
jgi:hypothetical protein